MLFPLAQPNGALGLGVQAGAGYAQLFNAQSGLVVATVGGRYVLGNPRTAYWVDINGGYGISSDENIGGAPYLDIGIGWQFASAPTFMWGIAGRWSFFFPREPYVDPVFGDSERNYSLLSLALVLEWGPPRWQEATVTPVPIAQGPQPVQAQPGVVQPVAAQPYNAQPGPAVVQPGPGPAPGPTPVQPIPIANQNQPPPQNGNTGPVMYSNAGGPPDQDGDGIPDDADACPAYAEDLNGRDDADGCPDADRDADGVPDVLDQCPNRPEDFDSDRDSDGCPD